MIMLDSELVLSEGRLKEVASHLVIYCEVSLVGANGYARGAAT